MTFLLSSSPSSSSLAPQIHKEYQVNLYQRLKYTKHTSSFPPCFRWPLKIKYTRSTRSPFSDTPQIHKSYIEFPPCFRWPLRSPFSKTPQIRKTYVEFPSLFSMAPKNQIHKEYQVTLIIDTSNTQDILRSTRSP